jgi:hypothetical protein
MAPLAIRRAGNKTKGKTPVGARRGKPDVNRCHQCEGRFGLIRHRYALRQFCSKDCLHEYQLERERKVTRIKQGADFLGRERRGSRTRTQGVEKLIRFRLNVCHQGYWPPRLVGAAIVAESPEKADNCRRFNGKRPLVGAKTSPSLNPHRPAERLYPCGRRGRHERSTNFA